MPAKKEVEIFSVSFLDLITGVLGAVLILFIIIPKMSDDVEKQLQELDQLKAVKVEVARMDSLMAKLKKNVSPEVYKQLEDQVKKLHDNTDGLQTQIKDLQMSLEKADRERDIYRNKTQELLNRLDSLNAQHRNHDRVVKDLREQVADLQQKLNDCQTQKDAIEKLLTEKNPDKIMQELKETIAKLDELQKQNAQLQDQNNQLKNKADIAKTKADQLQKQLDECPKIKPGFDLKDETAVFVVDLSGSMDDAPEPEKLDAVKTGLKMMIATMDDSYKIDIVTYPKSKDESYAAKYGKLVTVTEQTKYDIYRYLNGLKAYGCTPTRDVMTYVLSSPAYASAKTIVLLSDGVPTKMNGSECVDEDVNDVANAITEKNNGRKINCIGVGSEFRNENMNDPKVRFMKTLASKNDGFYIGF
ncbi:MAG: VWA domain-containing protein [Sphingobacteriales bacterium]|nr:VWA domain-containing protein [Sphingobacteriales bacterium]MCC7224106.1 VWA domain-containing protein [Chitinophagales bacterium]